MAYHSVGSRLLCFLCFLCLGIIVLLSFVRVELYAPVSSLVVMGESDTEITHSFVDIRRLMLLPQGWLAQVITISEI